jgi:soluble lytic murein transglycosylase-like protein
MRSSAGRACLALSVLSLWGSASTASADLYFCTAPDGSVAIVNQRPPGMTCRRERSTPRPESPSPEVVRAASAYPMPQFTPPATGTAAPTGDRYTRYDAYIEEAARLFQLPVPFIRAVVKVESDFHHTATSRVGAMGLMQLMPGTARSMGVMNPFDPRQNILGGARYLRVLANMFRGDLVLTVAAYNAGEGAVQRYGGVPPYEETQRYVQRVLHHYYAFRSGTGSVRDRR